HGGDDRIDKLASARVAFVDGREKSVRAECAGKNVRGCHAAALSGPIPGRLHLVKNDASVERSSLGPRASRSESVFGAAGWLRTNHGVRAVPPVVDAHAA